MAHSAMICFGSCCAGMCELLYLFIRKKKVLSFIKIDLVLEIKGFCSFYYFTFPFSLYLFTSG